MVPKSLRLPALSKEEAAAERKRYIAGYAAAWAAASPAERELETLERKTRLSSDELARMRELQAITTKRAA